ncbi:C-type lectin-like [Chiloscyllium punctatum]|uniref:C-type lectin-like n=1 Tax=Chiloscyllium punctatum TaxID=137246 RepID=UPI003B634887
MMLLMGLVLSTLMVSDVAADELTTQNSTHLDQNLEKFSPPAKGDCPGGLTYFGCCYKFIPEKKTWIDAELHCQHLAPGGHLASLHWMEQNNVLAEMIQKSQNNLGPAWIGLSDTYKEGTFLWIDGSASDFMFWSEGEPNDHGRGEDCVHAFFKNSFYWNDASCNLKMAFLCSYKLVRPCCY